MSCFSSGMWGKWAKASRPWLGNTKSSAWNAHSEAILLSLLVGSKEDRGFAVDKILKNQKGFSLSGRHKAQFRHNPVTLNLNANSIQDMIEWDKEVLHEPYLTCSMTEEELQAAVLNGLEVPYFPVHGIWEDSKVSNWGCKCCCWLGQERRLYQSSED